MPIDANDLTDGFVYAFKVEKVFAPFPRLSEVEQCSVEQNIVNVIYESFVIPADEDYLMARLLAQKGLNRGFFWAASQALEKYLKAFLLMHDHGVKKLSKGHPLKALFDAAISLDPDIASISLALHQDIKIDAMVLARVKVFTVHEFIDNLSVHGDASNRYNASGVIFNTGHMFALDAFVFLLRKKIGVLGIEESFERVSKDLTDTFYNNNYRFAKSSVTHSAIPSPEFPIKHSLSATRLDYLWKHRQQLSCSIALQWLDTKMKLSDKTVQPGKPSTSSRRKTIITGH